jgi:glucose 1-dehydrogenase/3-oxoacyl-[acyl-carrier protein] reductase
MDTGLDGETAVVTASSSGLGKASAASLVREGANVVVCGRDEERLAAASEDVAAAGPGAVHAVPTDITEPEQVSALVDAAVSEFGGLDHVVTSAGGPPSGPFLDVEDRAWYDAYDLLVMSVVWTLHEAHSHLAASDAGTVTCITSKSVREPIEGLVLSNAVRRSVIGLVKTVAREFAPDVRVNAVLPGTHETPRIEELVRQAMARGEYDSYEAGVADWADGIPMERVGDPRELGDVVTFLASERAGFVTGVALPVDGGATRS